MTQSPCCSRSSDFPQRPRSLAEHSSMSRVSDHHIVKQRHSVTARFDRQMSMAPNRDHDGHEASVLSVASQNRVARRWRRQHLRHRLRIGFFAGARCSSQSTTVPNEPVLPLRAAAVVTATISSPSLVINAIIFNIWAARWGKADVAPSRCRSSGVADRCFSLLADAKVTNSLGVPWQCPLGLRRR